MCEFRRALNNINAIGWLLRAPTARTALLRYRVNHPLMCRYFAGSVMCMFHCTCIARAFYAGAGCCGGACGLTLASEYGPGPLCVAACSAVREQFAWSVAGDCPPPCRYCAAAPGKASGISSICVRDCRGREGIPHMRIPLRVARHLRRGELLGGAIMQTHATQCPCCSIVRGVPGSMCEYYCTLSVTYTGFASSWSRLSMRAKRCVSALAVARGSIAGHASGISDGLRDRRGQGPMCESRSSYAWVGLALASKRFRVNRVWRSCACR